MVLGAVKAASAAARQQFVGVRVWRAVGAKEKACLARGGGVAQGKAVFFAFGDGQAIVVRFDAAGEDVVAVDHQVVRGDRGAKRVVLGARIIDGVCGGDVFHDHAQAGCARRIGSSTRSMNTASRSKMSTS